MKSLRGNIWDFYKQGDIIVIPTNIGWKKDGSNVMGAGIAKQLKNYLNISLSYGLLCKEFKENIGCYFYNDLNLIMFPTKSLNQEKPWLSWQSNSSLAEIEKSCISLVNLINQDITLQCSEIYLPLVGCGNGKLNKEDVLPILEKYFDKFDNIILVELN